MRLELRIGFTFVAAALAGCAGMASQSFDRNAAAGIHTIAIAGPVDPRRYIVVGISDDAAKAVGVGVAAGTLGGSAAGAAATASASGQSAAADARRPAFDIAMQDQNLHLGQDME